MNRSGDLGAGLDGQVAFDIDIALEAAGHANVTSAFDLAVDCETGSDHRLLGFLRPRPRRRLVTRRWSRKRVSILSPRKLRRQWRWILAGDSFLFGECHCSR